MDDERTFSAATTTPPATEGIVPAASPAEPAKKTTRKKRPRKKEAAPGPQAPAYEFPAAGKQCPRCQSWDTKAASTQGNVQYRQCQRGICRHRYPVMGQAMDKRNT